MRTLVVFHEGRTFIFEEVRSLSPHDYNIYVAVVDGAAHVGVAGPFSSSAEAEAFLRREGEVGFSQAYGEWKKLR